MRVAVTGASGLIGSAVVPLLRERGHDVVKLVRRPPAAGDEVRWDPSGGSIDRAGLAGVDAAVHLAGEGIGDGRWNDERKRRILASRVEGTTLLARTLAELSPRPAVLVSASGVNYYGYDRGDEILTESSTSGDGFLAEVCRQWEQSTAPAAAAGVRTVTLRTGIVLSRKGGALARQLPLFKAGVGGRLGSGRAWWSWISLADIAGLYAFALEHDDVHGPLDATAPNPVRNAELTETLGRILHRPTLLPVPRFGPALLFGADMAREVVFSNLRVLPVRAEEAGYRFTHAELPAALQAELAA